MCAVSSADDGPTTKTFTFYLHFFALFVSGEVAFFVSVQAGLFFLIKNGAVYLGYTHLTPLLGKLRVKIFSTLFI